MRLGLGDKEGAIDALEQAYHNGEGADIYIIRVDPFMDDLRGHPRFEALAEKIVPAREFAKFRDAFKMNPRNFFAELKRRNVYEVKRSIWKPGNQEGKQVNNQESRKAGNKERTRAINAFSYFPAFLIHLLPASSRGSSGTEMNPRNFFAELKRRNVYKVAVAPCRDPQEDV